MAPQDYGDSRLLRALLTLLGMALIAVGIVCGGVVLDHDTVRTEQQLAETSFGLPLEWVDQDLSSLDPPLPYEMAFHNPRTYSTSIEAGPLAVNVAAVMGVELVIYGAVVLSRRRNRPGW